MRKDGITKRLKSHTGQCPRYVSCDVILLVDGVLMSLKTAPLVDPGECMNIDHRWNDIDRGYQKYSERILSHCHLSHNKPHVDCPVIEPGSPRWETVAWPGCDLVRCLCDSRLHQLWNFLCLSFRGLHLLTCVFLCVCCAETWARRWRPVSQRRLGG